MHIDLSSAILHSLIAALRAGDAILAVYQNQFSVSYKEDSSPLTDADRAAHEVIVRTLSAACGGLPVLSEEGKAMPYADRCLWPTFWLVDPLDGTKEFVKRNGEFTVNIALIQGKHSIAGVVYAPVNDRLYFAGKGRGAWVVKGSELSRLFRQFMSDKTGSVFPIPFGSENMILDAIFSHAKCLDNRSSARQQHGLIRIVGSRSHGDSQFSSFIDSLNSRYGAVEQVSIGSSLKFCLIAEGTADIYPRFGPTMEWDTGAGDFIVKEAGGRVVGIATREELDYNKESLLNPAFIALSSRYSEHKDLILE